MAKKKKSIGDTAKSLAKNFEKLAMMCSVSL